MCHWILFNTFENSVLGWPSSSSLWSVAAVRPGASVEASIENSCSMHFSKCVAGMKPQVQSPALKIRKTSACTAKLEKLRQEAHLIIVLKADLGNRVKPYCKTYKGKSSKYVRLSNCPRRQGETDSAHPRTYSWELGHICTHICLSIAALQLLNEDRQGCVALLCGVWHVAPGLL